MTIKVLRCYKNNGIPYGEYYISDGDSTHLVFQNGCHIRILPHLQGESVPRCVLYPTGKITYAIEKINAEYLSTETMYDNTDLLPEVELPVEFTEGECY